MKNFLVCSLFLVLLIPVSSAQLLSSEKRILFQVQQLLEYPQPLQGWNNWTNFCFLPQTPSLVITCSGNHITELTILGNKGSHLSQNFSLDSFFTLLTKLSSLTRLSLVNLGLWGSLPAKITRFGGLEVLNLSSNRIRGSIPQSIAKFKNLKSLDLSQNLFNGSIPDLKGLSGLKVVDLSGNNLGPSFPSLGNNIVKLVLANNSLRSQVPQELRKLNLLTTMDLSSNKLVGPIPSFLFSLPSLEYINLARNQLSGALQPSVSCSKGLSFVDISNNLLIGKLPVCLLGSKSRNRTVISLWNCLANSGSKYQHQHSFCAKQALAVNPNPRAKSKGEESTIKLGIVLGVIGGIVAVVGGIGLLVLVIYRKVSRRRDEKYRCESFVFDKNLSRHPQMTDGGHGRRPMRMVSLGLPPYNVFTLEEMEDATSQFDPSNLVGEGSQGQLYRGKLRDGSVVLVNCQKLKQKHPNQILQQHMETISKLRHRHLMSVLGHCIVTYQDNNTPTTVFIVLENIATGSLKDHLTDWRKRDVLKWPQRMGMAMGIAKGIQYLHTGGVTGNTLKLENVLLDETLTARITNYNISLPSKIVSDSPLHAQDHHISAKSREQDDIYQLGVILIEIVIGRPINSQAEAEDLKLQMETCLAESPGKLRDLTDPCIRATFAYESLKTTVQIALNCLCVEPSMRPSIEDVLWHLQYSIQVQEGWGNSGNLSGNLSGKLSGRLSGNLSGKLSGNLKLSGNVGTKS
nr:probable LRR receptor-like serine/threonine-protein kinase At1g14390 [Ipomoea batatas]